MLTRFNRLTIAVLSGVTASLAITTAGFAAQDRPVVVYAEPQENVRIERVSYADLNLAERRDERQLRLRVAGAVRRVCLFENGKPGLQDGGYYRCASGARDGAGVQIAQAVQRARDIALNGESSIPAVAITVSAAAS